MPDLSLPPAFVSDVNLPLSAADLDMLRDAAIALDGLSFRRMNMCTSNVNQRDNEASSWHAASDFRQSWWGLRLRTGMTTLTIEGTTAVRLDFYINGTFNSFQAASAPFSKAITLGAFTDGDILLLEIKTNGNTTRTAKTVIYDVYVGPIVVSSSYAGTPSFAGTYSAALLNQLRTDAQNLYDRINAVPIAPLVANIMTQATHKAETLEMFAGSVGRYETSEALRFVGQIYCQNTAEHLELFYGGSLAYTSPTYTVGQSAAFSTPITLTHTLGTRAEVIVNAVVTSTPALNPPQNFSVYSFTTMRSESGFYPVAAPPTAFTAEESITATTLNTRLNAIAAMLSTVKTRLDTRTDLWNRARACRRVPAIDDTQVTRNMKRHGCLFQRQGDVLVVRGKGVKIGYGAITVTPPGENEAINYSKFTFAYEQSVGSGDTDKITTETVYLDSLPGLYPGMLYYVYGGPVLEGCWELLS
jgi:hypothetical protein